jgi:hypothetical protein
MQQSTEWIASMINLKTRVDRLEQVQVQGTYCLLYTDTWSKEQLETQVARLKQTYSSVLPIQVYEEDMAL